VNKTELTIAFCEAVSDGKLAKAKKLLAQGADPNKKPEGWTAAPIGLAVNAGHEAVAKWLLGLKVKLPADLLQWTAYANGIYGGKFRWLVLQLIEGGANVNKTDSDGLTPMFMLRDPELIELALARGGKLDRKSNDGSTPLHWAARAASNEVIGLLLDRGADPKAKDKQGKTPLAYAKALGRYGKETVAFLVERTGAKPAKVKAKTWANVEDALVKAATKAVAAFAKRHKAETFSRFAFDCNSAYTEVLPSFLPADGKQLWTIGDWKYQEIANIELDVEGLADGEEREPFMTMACRALIRLEREPAFAAIAKTKKFETLAIDHEEGSDAAVARRRLQKARKTASR